MAVATTQTSPIHYNTHRHFSRKDQPARPRQFHLESLIDTCITAVRNASHFWITHIILLVILAGYAIGGAYLFNYFESKTELERLLHSQAIRNQVIVELWLQCQNNGTSKETWDRSFKTKMWGYRSELCSHNVWMEESVNSWNLERGVFYCASIFTATGYGNIVARSSTGQILTIIYTVIGIPYTLTVLVDMGALMTSGLRKSYIGCRKIFWKRRLRQRVYTMRTHDTSMSASTPSSVDENRDEFYLSTGLRQSEFFVPVWLGWLLIIIYSFLGAWMFAIWELWSYREALYFVFISLTTIGFGDYVPKHASYAVTFCYILIGLALVSLIFNLIVERISKAMRKARRKIRPKSRRDSRMSRQINDQGSETEDRFDVNDLRIGNGTSEKSTLTVRLVEKLPSVDSTYDGGSIGFKSTSSTLQGRGKRYITLELDDINFLRYVESDKRKKSILQRRQAFITEKKLHAYLQDRMKSRTTLQKYN